MDDERDYEFEAGLICAEILFETAADDAAVMAALEIGLNAAQAVLPAAQRFTTAHELSILICDDAAMTQLNSQWRGKAYPTNVLSFPALLQNQCHPEASPKDLPEVERDQQEILHCVQDDIPSFLPFLGDMAICLPTAYKEAAEMGVPPAHHITHLAIHSLLHLLGYDHETEAEAAVMEALEIEAMAHIGLPNPYEGDRCRPVM